MSGVVLFCLVGVVVECQYDYCGLSAAYGTFFLACGCRVGAMAERWTTFVAIGERSGICGFGLGLGIMNAGQHYGHPALALKALIFSALPV